MAISLSLNRIRCNKEVFLYIREFSAVSSDMLSLIVIELAELSLSVHLLGTSSQTPLTFYRISNALTHMMSMLCEVWKATIRASALYLSWEISSKTHVLAMSFLFIPTLFLKKAKGIL